MCIEQEADYKGWQNQVLHLEVPRFIPIPLSVQEVSLLDVLSYHAFLAMSAVIVLGLGGGVPFI